MPPTPANVLARLRDKLLSSLSIDSSRLKMLIDAYVKDSEEIIGPSGRHSAASMYADFTKEQTTVRSFFKFLRVLQFHSVEFTVKITTKTNKVVTVSDSYNLRSFDDSPDGKP